MALKSKISSTLEQLNSIIEEITSLQEVLGSNDDSKALRKSLTTKIREATSFCKSIRRTFNRIDDFNDEEIQSLQNEFISLHSDLMDSVSMIRTKTKQFPLPRPNAMHHQNDQIHLDQTLNDQSHSMMNGKGSLTLLQHSLFNIKPMDNEQDNNQQDLSRAIAEDEVDECDECEHPSNPSDPSEPQRLLRSSNSSVIGKILKESWLQKKSRYLKSWRTRWVVLDENSEDITLFTFKRQREYVNPTESVVIDEKVDIQQIDCTENVFIIHQTVKECKFMLRASDRESRKMWIQILRKYTMTRSMVKDLEFVTPPRIREIQNILIHSDPTQHIFADNGTMNNQIGMESVGTPTWRGSSVSNHSVISTVSDETDSKQSDVLTFDAESKEVRDCLSLIDDLTHLREKENIAPHSDRVITQFRASLDENGFVDQQQIDQVRDISIALIGFMFDRSGQDT